MAPDQPPHWLPVFLSSASDKEYIERYRMERLFLGVHVPITHAETHSHHPSDLHLHCHIGLANMDSRPTHQGDPNYTHTADLGNRDECMTIQELRFVVDDE